MKLLSLIGYALSIQSEAEVPLSSTKPHNPKNQRYEVIIDLERKKEPFQLRLIASQQEMDYLHKTFKFGRKNKLTLKID